MESSIKTSNTKVLTFVAISLGVLMIILMIKLFADLSPQPSGSIKKETKPSNNQRSTISSNITSTDLQSLLNEAASELNKSCPMMVDKITRLDNATVMPSNEFQYNYTLINAEEGDIDVKALEANLRPVLENTIHSNPDLRFFRDNHTIMSYVYNDKHGLFLLKISINPDEYSR